MSQFIIDVTIAAGISLVMSTAVALLIWWTGLLNYFTTALSGASFLPVVVFGAGLMDDWTNNADLRMGTTMLVGSIVSCAVIMITSHLVEKWQDRRLIAQLKAQYRPGNYSGSANEFGFTADNY